MIFGVPHSRSLTHNISTVTRKGKEQDDLPYRRKTVGRPTLANSFPEGMEIAKVIR
jgi:hypothetical protein